MALPMENLSTEKLSGEKLSAPEQLLSVASEVKREQLSVNSGLVKSANRRPEDEDDRLLLRIAQNDELAFRSLVERHIDRAYALALRILRNAADAEDVSQEAMLKVWVRRGTWQAGNAKFSTWLYRVVTNRCIDLHRHPRTEGMEKAPDLKDETPDAFTSMHRGEVADLLDTAMRRLPSQQRIALILSYTDEMKNAEIAEIMETTVMAVESLLKRGRQKLRQFLRKSEDDIRDSFTSN